MKRLTLLFAASLALLPLVAETVRVADCERDPKLDFWAAEDNEFCRAVMDDVFRAAGLTAERIGFGEDHMADLSGADVVCSAFRTRKLLEDFDFPQQPLGRMHFALYATPSHAMELMSVKITEWPRMRIGYSPVSQGQATNDDRVKYFEHARLAPTYVEIPTSEGAVDEICDDFPKYLRMISEHHYGKRSDMAALSMEESSWLNRRLKDDSPVVIDFSPWPFPLLDKDGKPAGFVGDLLREIHERTGLVLSVHPQTDINTAEAKFLRGDTDLWIPYPVVAVTADVDVGSTYDMSLFANVISKPVTTDKLRALFS